jgi:hypothetical protein
MKICYFLSNTCGFQFIRKNFLISIENLNVKEVDLLVGEDAGYVYQGNTVKLMS